MAERLAVLEALVGRLTEARKQSDRELEKARVDYKALHAAYTRNLEELALLKRRLFVGKAERPPAPPEQLLLDPLFEQAKTEAEQHVREAADAGSGDRPSDASAADDGAGASPGATEEDAPPSKPRGRRQLDRTKCEVERLEIHDPELHGKFPVFRYEESEKLAWKRGGPCIVVTAVALYRVPDEQVRGETKLVTAARPREVFRRGLLAPSFVAHILAAKYVLGVPFYRLEDELSCVGAPLDRGTMCRYAEEAGAVLGGIVIAMREEALRTAFCLSTDATGVAVQPARLPGETTRKACRKAHFFVVLADRDHVFFEYQAKHTSAVVCDMFRGFSGYIQADAHAVYDALFAGRTPSGADPPTGPPPIEVACWAHARRKFWEAAVCKQGVGVEGLRRIANLYEIDRAFARLAPEKRARARQAALRPLVESLFLWAEAELEKRPARGLTLTALGYTVRNKIALTRFLEDGRLKLDNNHSERAARKVATGRKAWLFVGSDDHGAAAANLLSLVASCRLHGLDPEAYLAETLRLMAFWPADRLLELSPRHWENTRARLDPAQLGADAGRIDVPLRLAAEEQAST